MFLVLLCVCGGGGGASGASAAVNIVLWGDVQAGYEAYGDAIGAAAFFWESQLTGYRDGASAPDQIAIQVTLMGIDGAGGVLGSAGPSRVDIRGDFMEPLAGSMTFDTADLGVGSLLGNVDDFYLVALHEMAHALGFGTLWSGSAATGGQYAGFQEVYVFGSGQYVGEAGLAAFQKEFDQPEATFVPVELDGGPGTANGHWNMGGDLGQGYENPSSRDDPGDSIVYTSLNNGLALDDELMTGYLSGEVWLSQTTLYSFYDIGYEVIPERADCAFILGLFILCVEYYRKPRRW